MRTSDWSSDVCSSDLLREAQLMQRQGRHGPATQFLTKALSKGGRSNLRLRSQRAYAAARSGDLRLAREDLGFLSSLPNNEARAKNLEAHILLAEGKPNAAFDILQALSPQEPGDWHPRAPAMEAIAAHPDTGIAQSLIRN